MLSYRSKKTNNPNPSPIGNRFGLHGFGASGDIGFISKASNINGLRTIEQQYLQKNCYPNMALIGILVVRRPLFCANKKDFISYFIDISIQDQEACISKFAICMFKKKLLNFCAVCFPKIRHKAFLDYKVVL